MNDEEFAKKRNELIHNLTAASEELNKGEGEEVDSLKRVLSTHISLRKKDRDPDWQEAWNESWKDSPTHGETHKDNSPGPHHQTWDQYKAGTA